MGVSTQVQAALAAMSSETVRGTSVAVAGMAVLIEGQSGSGKSDLALRLIDRGAILVSDDYTVLVRDKAGLSARPAANIAGQIEVRGVGIVTLPHLQSAPLALIVRLVDKPERLPVDDAARRIAGVEIPEIALNALEPSAPIKVEMALKRQRPAA
jgi:serine kinase of HPr protein (carbohydrate metabolism regulator)